MSRLLDLCCKAGVGADGYADAGWEVVGVDIDPQPNYPYMFIRADAFDALDAWTYFNVSAIHASFPCQLHTRAGKLRDAQGGTSRFDDLLTPGLEFLRQVTIPWVCENVPGTQHIMAPRDGETLIMLCGSMFNLACQRHRLFLSNVPLTTPGPCDHSTFEPDPITGKPRPWGVYHVMSDSIPKGGRTVRSLAHGKEVMGVPADRPITWEGLKEGIPPAYTRWIGEQLLALTPVRECSQRGRTPS